MDTKEEGYPDDFAAAILLLEQLGSILHRDCARVAEGKLRQEIFYETVSAAHEAVLRTKEIQERIADDPREADLRI